MAWICIYSGLFKDRVLGENINEINCIRNYKYIYVLFSERVKWTEEQTTLIRERFKKWIWLPSPKKSLPSEYLYYTKFHA